MQGDSEPPGLGTLSCAPPHASSDSGASVRHPGKHPFTGGQGEAPGAGLPRASQRRWGTARGTPGSWHLLLGPVPGPATSLSSSPKAPVLGTAPGNQVCVSQPPRSWDPSAHTAAEVGGLEKRRAGPDPGQPWRRGPSPSQPGLKVSPSGFPATRFTGCLLETGSGLRPGEPRHPPGLGQLGQPLCLGQPELVRGGLPKGHLGDRGRQSRASSQPGCREA